MMRIKYGSMNIALIRTPFPDKILIDIEADGKSPTVWDNSTVENDFASCNACVDANLERVELYTFYQPRRIHILLLKCW